MDEQLQAQIEEARAQGYTDQQIEEFLKQAPVPAAGGEQFVDRTEEAVGLGQYLGGKALMTGAELGAGLYGGKKLLEKAGQAFGRGAGVPPAAGPAVPTPTPAAAPATAAAAPATAPTTFTGGANPEWDRALSRQPQTQPGVMQRGMDIASKMRQIAADRVIQPAAATARAAAPMAAGAVPAAALAGAAQQAGAADINNPGANIFAAPAAAGKQFADWANTVFGSEERYKKIREAQRAGLTGQ